MALFSDISPLEARLNTLEEKLSQIIEYLRDHFDEHLFQAHTTARTLNSKLQALEKGAARHDMAHDSVMDLVPFRASF